MKSASAVCIVVGWNDEGCFLKARVETAGVQNAGRVEDGFETAMEREQRIGQRMERADGFVGCAKQCRMTPVVPGVRPHARRIRALRRGEPAQRAAPFDHLFTAEI